MIFASDLDQTLIFSKRRLEHLPEEERVVIEYKDGEPLSYMSRRSQELLKQVSTKCTFIPITTRIMDQYKRIDLGVFKERVPYAIISNGGRVLIDGVDDPFWRDHISTGLKEECLTLKDVHKYFIERYSGDWVKSIRIAEELFIYCIVDPERTPLLDLNEFKHWLNSNNWDLSIQGRKIYFIPRVLQKSKALKYLGNKIGKKLFAGAGDSFLDLSFLKIVKYPIIPRHGELINKYSHLLGNINITKDDGIYASDELLTEILNKL